MSPPIERGHQLKIWLSEEERDALQSFAEREGLTVSDFVRQWIRKQLASPQPASKPKTKKKT